ncbi:MAG: hypothetical protein JNL28_02310 [Planctomycetes bacterium]|nr:hypothetical protein [Planctomycetota bacterium]
MFELSSPALSSEKARLLLRRLRDLNLNAGPVAVTRAIGVVFAGCTSLDGPAEAGVRYRLRHSDGSEGLLEIGWRDSNLELALEGAASAEKRVIAVPVTCDRKGRACARRIGARITPESTNRRELEHFLRRIVRSICR